MLTTLVTMGLMLSACGQKGPLTLVSTSKPAAATSAARNGVVEPAVAPASAPVPPPRTWGAPPT
ncbi:MAG: LPS translocon maturation chaperone LptM [Rhizobacter sp.]